MTEEEERLVLGRVPTEEEVHDGVAKWCWTCGNGLCRLHGIDALMVCDSFVERSRKDMEADPHFSRKGGS